MSSAGTFWRTSTSRRDNGQPPLIGITTDIVEAPGGRLKTDAGLAYSENIAAAGGIPLLLPAIPGLVQQHAAICDAFVFSGGDDPRMEAFGEPTHPQAKPMHPLRQEYELALLKALNAHHPHKPILGICLGMQLMALTSGGKLNQHLADTLPTAAQHRGVHEIRPLTDGSPLALAAGPAWSNHHQAISDPGSLTILAESHDGIIEAVGDLNRPFYIGIQWHPERTQNPALGLGIFQQLVAAALG